MSSNIGANDEGSDQKTPSYGFKPCLRRVYVTFLVIFLPLLGLASTVAPDPQIKANLILGFFIISIVLGALSATYPTNRKLVYIPISYVLLVVLGVVGSVMASMLR